MGRYIPQKCSRFLLYVSVDSYFWMPAVNFFEMSESCNISRTFGFYNDLINKSKRIHEAMQ